MGYLLLGAGFKEASEDVAFKGALFIGQNPLRKVDYINIQCMFCG